jgi:hypothetical protein
MSEEIQVAADGSVDFDFGFDKFKAMGFQFEGRLIQCRIEQPKEAEYSFVDKRNGQTVTKKAKPQLVLLIEPLTFQTKSGNPIPEYLPLTHNVRSKLGIFIEHLRNLGVTLGNDPTQIEGRVFEWEVKEVDFGGSEPTRVNVPIGVVDALGAGSTPVMATAPISKFADFTKEQKAEIAELLNGVMASEALATVAPSAYGKNPKVIAGIADKTLLNVLEGDNLLRMEDGRFYATAA